MAITIVQRNKSKGVLTWYARVPDPSRPGAVHYFSLGTSSKAEAKALLQARIRDGSFDERTAEKAIPEGFLGKAHAHRFRHSFGSNLIRADVNVKVVQTLMRHESIQMTLDIYGHILDVDADDAIAKAFP